jgi:hypothetical protein
MLDLQLGGYVNHHMDHHFTVVTICNWEHYQNGKLKDGPPPEPPHGPPPGPPTPEIEGARVREEEKKKEDMLTDPKPKAPTPKPATTKAKQREAIAGMIYAEYPKKVGKKKAIAAIIKALASESFDVLMEAAKAYAVANEGRVDKEHIPYPATWFNQERWTDDRSTWEEWKTKQAVSRPAYQLSAMEDPG